MTANPNNIILGAAVVQIDSTDVGYTKGGTNVRYEPEYVDVVGDQSVGVVKKFRSNEKMFVVITVLEITLARIRDAFNYPSANLSGSTLTLGYNNACYIVEHDLILTGVGPSCGVRTFHLTRCVAVGNREYKMSREEETAFEIEFECLKDSSGHFGTIVDS